MYLASDRTGGEGGNDLYVSRRRDKRDDSTGELTLYFDSNRVVDRAPGHCGPFTDDPPNRNSNDI
jgi:hypothetical protein